MPRMNDYTGQLMPVCGDMITIGDSLIKITAVDFIVRLAYLADNSSYPFSSMTYHPPTWKIKDAP